MTETLRGKVVQASGFHSPARGAIEAFCDALISIGEDGGIRDFALPGNAGHDALFDAARRDDRLVSLPRGSVLLPGFVDLHIHAPQYAQLGSALDVPLEVWLQKYTFPIEARYADAAFARRAYAVLVDDLLAAGTTTAMYYGTIHDEANRLLADFCIDKGQRALIGKVAMDDPDQCPDYYRDADAATAVAGTESLIDYIRAHPDNRERRVLPVVTPRFIPSCTDGLLEDLGALARDRDCHIQTHCSESDWEHGYAFDRFGASDTESLDRFGLLRRGAVLGHCNFLSAADMERIRVREAAVAHCPLSNAYFSGAVFPLKAALEKGLHIGLGTDMSAGFASSVFDSARSAITASRVLETGTDPDLASDARSRHANVRIDFRDAFHLATAGGGAALDLPIGVFRPGFRFDAMLIDPQAPAGSIRLWPEIDDGEQVLQKILFTASRANIERVWVDGLARAGTAVARNCTI